MSASSVDRALAGLENAGAKTFATTRTWATRTWQGSFTHVAACLACYGPVATDGERLTLRILSNGAWNGMNPSINPTISPGKDGRTLVLTNSLGLPSSNYEIKGSLLRMPGDSLEIEIRAVEGQSPGIDVSWRVDYESESAPLEPGTCRLRWWHAIDNYCRPRTLVRDTSITIPTQ